MSDTPQLDEDLSRLFDQRRAVLPPEAFLERFQKRMHRTRRIRLGVQLGLLAVLAVLAVIVAPYASRMLLAAIGDSPRWVAEVGLAMTSPLGWLCSVFLGLWVLRRSHVFER
jgi:hypothetical protein